MVLLMILWWVYTCMWPYPHKSFHAKWARDPFCRSLFFMSLKKIRLCAWDWFGPESDRCIYYQVESRVTKKNTTRFCLGFCCCCFCGVFFVCVFNKGIPFQHSLFSLISMSLFVTFQIFWLNEYFLQIFAQNPCLDT